MKKWGLISLVPVLLLAVIIAVTYGYKRSLKVPVIAEVVSADFSLNYVLRPDDQVPQRLVAERPEDRAVIEKVLGWVRSAKVIGKGPEPLPSMGYHLFVLQLTKNRVISLLQVRHDSALLFDTGDGNPVHLDSPKLTTWMWDGWKEDVKPGATTPPTSAVQLSLQAESNSVSTGKTIGFTVTFKNGGTTEATLMNPCGHPFNLVVKAGGQEIDDWLRQTYGGPPVCPPGPGVRVPPGESYSTTLSLRFPKRGTFSVYAITLSGDSILSNHVTLDVR